MPRIRSIKPELWQSPEVMNLSHAARLLFIGLITQADDAGKGSSDLRKLKAAIFPGDDLTAADVRTLLEEIGKHRLAVFYTVEGFGELYLLPSWSQHQYVPKAQQSRYPDPSMSLLPERYRNATGTLPERNRNATGGSEGSEGSEGTKGSDARARVAAKGGQRGARTEAVDQWIRGTA